MFFSKNTGRPTSVIKINRNHSVTISPDNLDFLGTIHLQSGSYYLAVGTSHRNDIDGVAHFTKAHLFSFLPLEGSPQFCRFQKNGDVYFITEKNEFTFLTKSGLRDSFPLNFTAEDAHLEEDYWFAAGYSDLRTAQIMGYNLKTGTVWQDHYSGNFTIDEGAIGNSAVSRSGAAVVFYRPDSTAASYNLEGEKMTVDKP